MHSHKIIIISLLFFLLASLVCLAWLEQKQRESGSFWALYFSEPKSDSLNFTIENHSQKNNFRWEASGGNKKMEGSLEIKKGSSAEITLSKITLSKSDFDREKITVRVFSGEEVREIYKYH